MGYPHAVRHRRRGYFICALLLAAAASFAQQRVLKPGFNLFKKEQDIQMGREYATQIEREVYVAPNAELTSFVGRIGRRLAATREADGYPYTFKVVQDKTINAFALPGGPTFTHTGLILAADNEAQVAGVLAHEISHVALRHSTNQASKAQLVALPALLAGKLGGSGIVGTLAQLGIGLGANSVLLKFSRDAERDADLLGTRIMSKAGYNPIEMARFFEKLEAESGKGNILTKLLSDHPNPGNRVKAVEAEIRYLPRRSYSSDSGQLSRAKQIIEGLAPAPAKPRQPVGQGDPAAIPSARPSSRLKEFRGREVVVSYPENWEVLHNEGNAATIAPRAGVAGGGIGYGLMLNFQELSGGTIEQKNRQLLEALIKDNPGMKVAEAGRAGSLNGSRAVVTRLESPSPYRGLKESDTVVAIERPGGLFYAVLIAPERDYSNAQRIFDQIINSIRFPN